VNDATDTRVDVPTLPVDVGVGVDSVVSTDPLPFVPPPLPPPIPMLQEPASAAPAPAVVKRRGRLRRLARVAAIAFALWCVVSEAAGWFQAERFREVIGNIDGPALESARASYERLASSGPLHLGLRLRVHRPLRMHLAGLADHVIEDYRHDQPSLSLADWKHAQQALRWSLRIDPDDRLARARLETCEAHILRITTRPGRSPASQAAYRKAIDRFRTAARLDPDSFDPYLGISRVAIYGFVPADVDLASSAIRDAEKRGYTPGRRERAQLGDGYLRRADALRRDARTLSGMQRTHALERARDDYQGCIDALEPIVGFGNAAMHIETCKAQRDRVNVELDLVFEHSETES
jgi:tetratricopeptide (TPR) repeat protein